MECLHTNAVNTMVVISEVHCLIEISSISGVITHQIEMLSKIVMVIHEEK